MRWLFLCLLVILLHTVHRNTMRENNFLDDAMHAGYFHFCILIFEVLQKSCSFVPNGMHVDLKSLLLQLKHRMHPVMFNGNKFIGMTGVNLVTITINSEQEQQPLWTAGYQPWRQSSSSASNTNNESWFLRGSVEQCPQRMRSLISLMACHCYLIKKAFLVLEGFSTGMLMAVTIL